MGYWLLALTLVVLLLYWHYRRVRAAIVGTWRRYMDYLLLTGVGAKRANGKVDPLAASDFTLVVTGPGADVPVPEWAPAGTQAAVLINGDEGTITTDVTAALYPDALPLWYTVDILNPVTDIVGNWTRVAEPA